MNRNRSAAEDSEDISYISTEESVFRLRIVILNNQ